MAAKKKPKIFIKPKNRGKFTASAKKAGKSVQAHAAAVLDDPDATPLQKKRANFARNSKEVEKGRQEEKVEYYSNVTKPFTYRRCYVFTYRFSGT